MLLDTAISAGFPSTGPPGPSSFTLQDEFFFTITGIQFTVDRGKFFQCIQHCKQYLSTHINI